MPTMDSLEDLLKDEIKDIYDAEKQLTKALPKLIKKATADDLKKALSAHLKETEGHIARLETGVRPDGHAGAREEMRGMQHLIAEGSEMIAECEEDGTRDAVIIAAAQKCEHYEICSYGTIRVWANLLNHTDVGSIFEQTLEEEKTADLKLTNIAEASSTRRRRKRAKAAAGTSSGSRRGHASRRRTERGASA